MGLCIPQQCRSVYAESADRLNYTHSFITYLAKVTILSVKISRTNAPEPKYSTLSPIRAIVFRVSPFKTVGHGKLDSRRKRCCDDHITRARRSVHHYQS